MNWKHQLVLLLALNVSQFVGCAGLNRYQTDGSQVVKGLDAPVKVVRDEKGMAYIHAGAMDDAIRALGYVTAQDRLFQMTLNRYFAEGRLAELFGEESKKLDIRNRTLGFHRQAIVHAEMLDAQTRRFFQHYVDGINAYIQTGTDTFALEFKLADISPEPWTIADALAIYYLMGWRTSANVKAEVVAHMLVNKLGEAKARQLFPLNINPDDEPEGETDLVDEAVTATSGVPLDLSADAKLMDLLTDGALEIGSNNWVAGPTMSMGGKPVVVNDPHMRTGILPGPLYPVGIITPDFRVVGAALPGLVGLPVFRNDYIAIGVTNAYADVQDLYMETIDADNGDHYLEGSESIPFTVIQERIKIKDEKTENGFRVETIKVRLTKRGPVVSDVLEGLETDNVLSIRWAAYATMAPTVGFIPLLTATSVESAAAAIGNIHIVSLNFVFADTAGNIAWRVSGRLPIRSDGGGTVPFAVTDSTDDWRGFVPPAQMPQVTNPGKNWLGTCNHYAVTHDYPYYFSSLASPGYRYRRLKQLMNIPGKKTVDDHWGFQRDTMNMMAQKLVPFMVDVLEDSRQTRELAELLKSWDRHDNTDAAGATVFHAIYERFAWLTFHDELGDDLARKMLGNWYFWQERFQRMILTDHRNHWFDDTATAGTVEGKRAILIRAAMDARANLGASLGGNLQRWQWGKVHRHTFVSPIRRSGFGKSFLGGGTYAAAGSGEVLYRGIYDYNDPYAVNVSAALRMIADLADQDKVLAVIAGGVTERVVHPHATDQIAPYMNGEKVYWWFSDKAIASHTRSVLMLMP